MIFWVNFKIGINWVDVWYKYCDIEFVNWLIDYWWGVGRWLFIGRFRVGVVWMLLVGLVVWLWWCLLCVMYLVFWWYVWVVLFWWSWLVWLWESVVCCGGVLLMRSFIVYLLDMRMWLCRGMWWYLWLLVLCCVVWIVLLWLVCGVWLSWVWICWSVWVVCVWFVVVWLWWVCV